MSGDSHSNKGSRPSRQQDAPSLRQILFVLRGCYFPGSGSYPGLRYFLVLSVCGHRENTPPLGRGALGGGTGGGRVSNRAERLQVKHHHLRPIWVHITPLQEINIIKKATHRYER